MNKNISFIILTGAVFLFLLLPSVFREGMFMDGLIYAAISKNLANGLGNFWDPYFTATFLPSFHEHPPLAFGLQSIFFSIFGDSFFVEKLYSFFTALIQATLIAFMWRTVNSENVKSLFWLPVLLWISIPLCFWTYSNNMLENTMAIFTTSAILLQVLAFKRDNPPYLYFILCGVAVFLGFLSKGLPALFPLAFPFIHWIVVRKFSLLSYLKSFSIIVFTIALVMSILYLIPEAIKSFETYFNTQVMQSLKGERVIGERYYIIKKLLMELIPAIILTVIFLIITGSKKISLKDANNNWILIFLLTGISASVPIVISPKQLGFYLVPSLPYFAMTFALIIVRPVSYLVQGQRTKFQRTFLFISISGLLAAIIFSLLQIGKFERDYEKISDVKKVGNIIGNGKTIMICQNMFEDWSLHGYFSRYFNISLDDKNVHHYRLADIECNEKVLITNSVQLKIYRLDVTGE